MNQSPKEDPKIIVDDDWKAQVEKEKREAAEKIKAAASEPEPSKLDLGSAGSVAASGDEPASRSPAGEAAVTESAADDAGAGAVPEPPPASFEMLVTMLVTQAMAALGQFPGPDGKMSPVDKRFAKYFIDTVELLGEKTRGNLSDEESKMLSESLHAMRMAFVSVKAK